MTRKMLWIALWTTLTLWLGNFWGCAASSQQAMVEDDGPGEAAAETVVASEAMATGAEEADAAAAPAVTPMVSSIEVAPVSGPMGTLDRSNWATVLVRPASGSVRHYPVYWQDYPLWNRDRGFHGDPLTDAVHALDRNQRTTFSSENFAGVVVQPVVFGLDTVLVAPRMVADPPWKHVYSK